MNIAKEQQPLHSGYDKNTTAAEIIQGIDLAGKNIIVTGGYSGIGLEAVKHLHAAGATVILPARNVAATRSLFAGDEDRIEVIQMDLLDSASIDAFAAQFNASGRPLHILINNAGIMACPLARDARGYESQLATNHLGHFQLTARLWDALKAAKGARVVTVSSLGHRYSDIVYGDPHFEQMAYDRWVAYGQSKTANILFSVHLDEIGSEYGIRAYALHPGRILDTNLKKYLSAEELARLGVLNEDGTIRHDGNMKTIAQGAATTMFCAVSPLLANTGGVYCENADVATVIVAGTDTRTMAGGVLPYAVDKDNARNLWELTERLTGINWHQ